MRVTSNIVISTQSSTVTRAARKIGRIHRFIATFATAYSRLTGRARSRRVARSANEPVAVGRISRRRNPPSFVVKNGGLRCGGNGGLRYADPPYSSFDGKNGGLRSANPPYGSQDGGAAPAIPKT